MEKTKIAGKITPAEVKVMQVLWEAGSPLSLGEIRNRLGQKETWSKDTIKTLLHRLLDKGALAQEKREVFYYQPLLSAAEYRQYSTQRVIDQLYAGNARELVVSLVENGQLSPEEMEELRAFWRGEEEK